MSNQDVVIDDDDERKAIHDFDFERALMLMNVMEKQANVAPKANHLGGIAQAELNEMNEAAKEIARARNDKMLQAVAAKRQADIEQRQKLAAEEAKARPVSNLRAPPEVAPGQPMPEGVVTAEEAAEEEREAGEPRTIPYTGPDRVGAAPTTADRARLPR